MDSSQNEIDKDKKSKDWLHPAEYVRIIETREEKEEGMKKLEALENTNSSDSRRRIATIYTIKEIETTEEPTISAYTDESNL
jgi:hypothetical protein